MYLQALTNESCSYYLSTADSAPPYVHSKPMAPDATILHRRRNYSMLESISAATLYLPLLPRGVFTMGTEPRAAMTGNIIFRARAAASGILICVYNSRGKIFAAVKAEREDADDDDFIGSF